MLGRTFPLHRSLTDTQLAIVAFLQNEAKKANSVNRLTFSSATAAAGQSVLQDRDREGFDLPSMGPT